MGQGRWREPKLTNKIALKRIANGDIWWDQKAIERAAVRRKHRRMLYEAQRAAKLRWDKDCAKGIQGCRIPTEVMYEIMFGFKVPSKGYNRH